MQRSNLKTFEKLCDAIPSENESPNNLNAVGRYQTIKSRAQAIDDIIGQSSEVKGQLSSKMKLAKYWCLLFFVN